MVWGIWNSLIEGVMDEWNVCISDAVGVKQTRGETGITRPWALHIWDITRRVYVV